MGSGRPCVDAGDRQPRHTGEARGSAALRAEAELALCQHWRDHHDISAARQLIGSYLCLVDEIATGYRGYRLASEELLGEGCVGLMHAVCRFDPDRSVRFAIYAGWWVRATILECILRNPPQEKMGTTASWKQLFLGLRSMHRNLRELHDGTLKSEDVGSVADLLPVPEHEIIRSNPSMGSADIPISADLQGEWPTWLVDDDAPLGRHLRIAVRSGLDTMQR